MKQGQEVRERQNFWQRHFAKIVILAMALSGMAALVYEVVANEVLFFFFDSSSYSLATVLSSFLGGLAIGSFLISKTIHKIKNKKAVFAIMQVLIGVYAIFFLTNFEMVPQYLSIFYNWAGENIALLVFSKFLIANIYLIFPTILLGASFPLAVSLLVKKAENAGKDVGTLYSADLGGAIVGAIVGGFLLIPLLGLKSAVFAGATMNFLSAALVIEKKKSKQNYLATGIVFVLLLFSFIGVVVPVSQEEIYVQVSKKVGQNNQQLSQLEEQATKTEKSSEEYLKTEKFLLELDAAALQKEKQLIEELFKTKNILFKADSPYGQVHVIEEKGKKLLFIDRRIMCPTEGLSEKEFPNIVIDAFSREINAAVIGLGCGITASTVAQHNKIKALTILEINPVVVKASEYFNEENNNVLENEKVELIVTDAAGYLLSQDKKFDAIFIDIENPQIAHSSPLYTVEYFKIMEENLTEDGALSIWGFSGDYDYTKTFYHSLKQAFPTVYLKIFEKEPVQLYYAFKKETAIPLNEQEKELNQRLEEDKEFELNTLDNQVLKNKFLSNSLTP